MSTPRDREVASQPPRDGPASAGASRDGPVDGDRGPTCPFCGSPDVELLSPFASQLSTSQYVCRACHTPFEYFTRDAEA
jgi:hypothetical protein